MQTKRVFAWGVAGILCASLAVMPVSASTPADSICEECQIADCTQTGYHVHGKEIYCGYTHEKGYCDGSCTAVESCGVFGCKQSGQHEHYNGHHNTRHGGHHGGHH